MKKAGIVAIFILTFIFSENLHAQADTPGQAVKALYAYYFWLKECVYCYFLYTYVVDYEKIQKAQIACKACHSKINSVCFHSYLACYMKSVLIKKLVHVVTHGSVERIAQFLLEMHEKYRFSCSYCHTYDGWYIVDTVSTVAYTL